MDIGSKIKEIRTKKKISQRKLAEKIGVSGQFISLVEIGKSAPSIDTLNKIADALDVSVNDLLGNSETQIDFDYSDMFSKDVLDESTNLFNEDLKTAFNKMYDRALKNLGIIEGLKYRDIHYSFVDILYLSVSITEIFRNFNDDMQSLIDSEKTSFTPDEVNSSIEVLGKYTFETYELLRKNMKLLEESDKFYTENPDRPYFEKEIFEKFLDN